MYPHYGKSEISEMVRDAHAHQKCHKWRRLYESLRVHVNNVDKRAKYKKEELKIINRKIQLMNAFVIKMKMEGNEEAVLVLNQITELNIEMARIRDDYKYENKNIFLDKEG